jgi:hypothetical protein
MGQNAELLIIKADGTTCRAGETYLSLGFKVLQ